MIHVVDDRGVVGLEDQQLAVLFSAQSIVEIVETHPLRRRRRARFHGRTAKSRSKSRMKPSSSCAFRTECHARVEVPDIPSGRRSPCDRHRGGRRRTRSGLCGTGHRYLPLIDETRDEEFLLRPGRPDISAIMAPSSTLAARARMRAAPADDDREFELSPPRRRDHHSNGRSRLIARASRGGGGISRPSIPRSKPCSLSRSRWTDKPRRIEKRSRPARGRHIDLAQRLQTFL